MLSINTVYKKNSEMKKFIVSSLSIELFQFNESSFILA